MSEFFIRGSIGEDCHAIALAAFLDSVPDKGAAFIAIDSVGGYVDEAFKMVGAIEAAQGRGVKVTTKALFVASAANLPFLAGDVRVATEGVSQFMIHNCWNVISGNAAELRQAAESQEATDSKMQAYYERRTGKSATFFSKYMDNDSYFDATTAAQLGFTTQTEKMKAMAKLSAPASQTATDSNLNFNESMNKKEKSFRQQVAALLGIKAEGDMPEDFPTEVVEEEDKAQDQSVIEERMNAVESMLKQIIERLDSMDSAQNECKKDVSDTQNAFMALAKEVVKASRGAVAAVELPKNDKAPKAENQPAQRRSYEQIVEENKAKNSSII